MKTLPYLKTVALSLTLIGLTGAAFAQQGPRNNNFDHMEKMREMPQPGSRIFALPDLTDEQKEQIRNVMTDTRKKMLPLQNQVREKAAQLITLRTAENADLNAIHAKVDELGSLKAEMMKTSLASEHEIRELLTDEQRIVFDSRKPMGKRFGPTKRASRMRGGN